MRTSISPAPPRCLRPTCSPRRLATHHGHLFDVYTIVRVFPQSTVDGGILFEEALLLHTEFLRRNSCLPGQERSCLFVTCGEAEVWQRRRADSKCLLRAY